MHKSVSLLSFLLLIIQLHASPNKKLIDSLNIAAGGYLTLNYDSSISVAEDTYQKALKIQYTYGIAKSLAIQARALDLKGLNNSAHLLYLEALYQFKASDTLDYYNEFRLLQNIGRTHYLFKQYQGAIDYYDSALQILNRYIDKYPQMASSYGDDKLVAVVQFDKAINLFALGKSGEAQKLFQSAEERAWEEENYSLIANIRNELGLIFNEAKNHERAREFYFPVLSYGDLDSITEARILHNIGSTYLKEGDFNKARDYYNKAISLNQYFVDKRSYFLSLLLLGKTQEKLGQIQEAIKLWEQALDLDYHIDDNPDHFVVYQYLRDAYFMVQKIDRFAQYQDTYDLTTGRYIEAQKRILEEDQILRFQLLTDVYYKRKQQLEENNQLYLYLAVIVPILALTGLLSVYYVRRRYRTRLEQTGDEILSILGD